jgi:hypothetical protein
MWSALAEWTIFLIVVWTNAGAQGALGQSSPSKPPFMLSLSTVKPEIRAGDPVDIRVVMTNTSDHDVDCTYDYSNALDRNYVYEISGENGHRVRKIEKEHHGGSDIWPCVLRPGQSIPTGGGRISVLYDFSQPGKYTIQVARPVRGDEGRPGTFRTGSDHPPFVRSNAVTVAVIRAARTTPEGK